MGAGGLRRTLDVRPPAGREARIQTGALPAVGARSLVRVSYFDVSGRLWSFWEGLCQRLQIESPQVVSEMNMRSFGKSADSISLSSLKKEQVPNPRIIFKYEEVETTFLRLFLKLVIHIADVLFRRVSFQLLPQMIYISVEESGNVVVANKFTSRNYSSKIAVPYRDFFAELDRFLLFGNGEKLANLIGREFFKSLEKVVNYAGDHVLHDVFQANVESVHGGNGSANSMKDDTCPCMCRIVSIFLQCDFNLINPPLEII